MDDVLTVQHMKDMIKSLKKRSIPSDEKIYVLQIGNKIFKDTSWSKCQKIAFEYLNKED